MSIAKTYSAQLIGLKTETIKVEVDISNGLHAFSIVGLGDRAIEEAKDRVSAAIKNTGYISPKQKNQKVTVSLAPADIHKEGPSFDLAIALTYLRAVGEIDFDQSNKLFLGELSLEGKVCRVNGILPILCESSRHGFTEAFIPKDNEREASLARGIKIYAVCSLSEVIAHLNGSSPLKPTRSDSESTRSADIDHRHNIRNIRGNDMAKRGLEIAAAGAHNVLMFGPPGTGKTMLAHSFPSILPTLTYEQSIEVTSIHSAARILNDGLVTRPPFRAPHHTASYPAIVGGGNFPKPGEITLAHRGVLFMDEFPEFDRSVIEAMRQPLEERTITISRARGVITFPAQCILIASMNPCPCGKGKERGCSCSQRVLDTYKRKLSGPIMDRIDIWLNIHKIDYQKLAEETSSTEDSSTIRDRVCRARSIQSERFERFGVSKLFNSEMDAGDIENIVSMDKAAKKLLISSAEKIGLSGRAFHRVIKVAQTITDLAGKKTIDESAILESIQYRQKGDTS